MAEHEEVVFFGAHPGFGGAAAPLPQSVKTVVDSLDGKTMKLFGALELLREAATKVDGEIRHTHQRKCIFLVVNPNSLPRHIWRLISYRAK